VTRNAPRPRPGLIHPRGNVSHAHPLTMTMACSPQVSRHWPVVLSAAFGDQHELVVVAPLVDHSGAGAAVGRYTSENRFPTDGPRSRALPMSPPMGSRVRPRLRDPGLHRGIRPSTRPCGLGDQPRHQCGAVRAPLGHRRATLTAAQSELVVLRSASHGALTRYRGRHRCHWRSDWSRSCRNCRPRPFSASTCRRLRRARFWGSATVPSVLSG